MKRHTACLSLLLGVLVSTPAIAADLDRGRGGMKDYVSGVPVPAPMPVHETFRWYLRADLGLGLHDAPPMAERGLLYGADSLAPFGTQSSWFSGDFDTFMVGGLGAGLYLSPRFRSDVTVDWRTVSEINAVGNYAYTQVNLAVAPPTPTGFTVNGNVREHVSVLNTVGLVNLYWDLLDRGRFTPYIGIGAGFVLRDVDRQYSNTETITNTGTGVTSIRSSVSAQGKASEVAVAAAAMAGASFALTPGVLLDVNYRMTYLGSVESMTYVNGTRSLLTVGETYEHALRAGLRWNVW